MACSFVIPGQLWRPVVFSCCSNSDLKDRCIQFYIVNLLEAMWVSTVASFCVVGEKVELITYMVESYVVLIGEA